MMTKKGFQRTLLVLGVIVFLVMIFFIIFIGYDKNQKVKIGVILTGSKDESGWNGAHYKGIKESCDELGAVVLVKENVPENEKECRKAIKELVDEGASMIILTSYAYPTLAKESIDKYSKISFYAISAEVYSDNMTSYFGRMYQARYLAGVLAGLKSESGNIGYVAAMPNDEVNRGINAFALGVRSVNEKAKVNVIWTNTWDDKKIETNAANKLIDECNADVLAYHQNKNYISEVADKANVYSIGYNEPVKHLSERHLSASVWNWKEMYIKIIREFKQGKANTVKSYWLGMDSHVVSLADFSKEVTVEERKRLEDEKQRIISGRDVFSGVIYDNNGILRCGENELISDEVLLNGMDWFVDGVVIYGE